MNGQQLEMRFDSQFRPLIRRRRCSTRARWWFAQMRQVVDRAWDWRPALTFQMRSAERGIELEQGREEGL